MVGAASACSISMGVMGANYHVVPDIIGGPFLGVCLGFGLVRLCLTPNDRLNWSIVNSKPRDEPSL
jgi:hypothetical protein